MSTPSPVTADDLRRHLNMTGGDEGELTFWLGAATLAVEGRVGPLVARSFTERREARNGVLCVARTPLVSVESLALPSGTTVAGTIDAHPSGVVSRRGDRLYGEYVVTYTAGREEVGENLSGAVLIVAGHLWETQRGNSARGRTLSEWDGATGAADVGAVLRGFALPRRALELLQPDDLGMSFA